jgi:hypothetical protein
MKPLIPPPPPCFVGAVQRPKLLPESVANNRLSQTDSQGSLADIVFWEGSRSSPGEISSTGSDTRPIWESKTQTDLPSTPTSTEFHSIAGWFCISP